MIKIQLTTGIYSVKKETVKKDFRPIINFNCNLFKKVCRNKMKDYMQGNKAIN